jgi:hypothetical protein
MFITLNFLKNNGKYFYKKIFSQKYFPLHTMKIYYTNLPINFLYVELKE